MCVCVCVCGISNFDIIWLRCNGYFRKIILFRNLISGLIFVQIISNFNIMC